MQGRVDISWGGKEGTTIDYSLTVEAHDNKGNHAEATVHQKDNGEGGLNVSAGHESKDKSSDNNNQSGNKSR